MGLMLVGFGLKDSITNIATLQYGELQEYDGMAYLSSDLSEPVSYTHLWDKEADKVYMTGPAEVSFDGEINL